MALFIKRANELLAFVPAELIGRRPNPGGLVCMAASDAPCDCLLRKDGKAKEQDVLGYNRSNLIGDPSLCKDILQYLVLRFTR